MIQLTVNKLHFYRFKLEAYVSDEFETGFEELQNPDSCQIVNFLIWITPYRVNRALVCFKK